MRILTLALVLLSLCFGGIQTAEADELLLPIIRVEPASVDFGTVPVWSVATQYVMIYNDGDIPLLITNVKTKAPFLDGISSPVMIPGHSQRRMSVGFAPQSPSHFFGVATIISNAANYPLFNIQLEGWGEE
ncbi:MAG: hypothetical protein R3E97_21480 [Candidatus Eisenbacteria bacterium]